MDQPQAYFDGRFVPESEARIPLDDLGFLLGATVTEQLRTFAGRLFHVEEHLTRLARSLSVVGLSDAVPVDPLAAIAEQLVANNHRLLADEDDLALSIFVTPGSAASPQSESITPKPRVGLHTFPLPFHRWAEKQQRGDSVVVTSIRQVPEECWPPELKCRSRMHYYLADREAAAREPGARAVLLDTGGHVTEATTANALLYRKSEGLVSPPRESVLPGISLAMLRSLAARQQVAWQERELTPEDFHTADEVLLSSTPFCLLPVTRFDGQPIGAGQPGPIYRQLLAAWSEEVGVNIAEQAKRFSAR
ncbi:MAG: aminotransferase class IV [Planctomycetia bacterium]|nr:aminotransferase class IV [Planctomycetia bacterium]